jgi:hypothetical protein
MEKMLYFVAGSPRNGLYSGYLHGISICHTIHG